MGATQLDAFPDNAVLLFGPWPFVKAWPQNLVPPAQNAAEINDTIYTSHGCVYLWETAYGKKRCFRNFVCTRVEYYIVCTAITQIEVIEYLPGKRRIGLRCISAIIHASLSQGPLVELYADCCKPPKHIGTVRRQRPDQLKTTTISSC